MLGLGNSITKHYGWSPRGLGTKFIHWYKFNTGITTKSVSDTPGFVSAWADQIGTNHLAPVADDDASEMPFLESDGTLFFQQNTDSLVFNSALSLGTFSIYVKHNMKEGQTVSSEVLMEGAADSIKLNKMAKNTSKKIKELKGIKPEKVDEQELARMQSSIKTIDQLTHEVGTIEVRKHALMKAMESVQQRIEAFRGELMKKYGTDNVTIADGTINYPEENPQPNTEENVETDKKD